MRCLTILPFFGLSSMLCIAIAQPATAQGGYVTVTPDGATTPQRVANSGPYTADFIVTNIGSAQTWSDFNILCGGAVNVTCTGVSQSVVSLAPGQWTTVTATYTVAGVGSGEVNLTALSDNDPGWDEGYYTVPVVNPPPPIVMPDGARRLIAPVTGAKLAFTVKNQGTTTRTYNLSVTCSGAATSCSVPSPVAVSPGQTRDVWPTFSVVGTTFQTGTLSLSAADAGAPTVLDNGSIAVTVAPVGPVVDRSRCLSIAAGAGAAFECGDLRLVHTLPDVRTLGKPRAPVLLYSSQQAHPYPLFNADVTLPSGTPLPTTVRVVLWINGTRRDSTDWPGSAWGAAGQTRRVVVRWDADTFSTKPYDYRLELKRINPSGVDSLPSVLGKILVVNRRSSPFGAGWWLAGYEQLVFAGLPAGQVLWIGGDGSAAIYQRSGPIGTDTAYLAPLVDRPDTLLHTAGNEWKRLLAGGDTVVFKSTGAHLRTANRLGYRTLFTDSSGFLVRIEVPPDSALKYRFTYSGSPARLTQVTIPDSAAGTYRVTSLAWAGDSVRVTDPGTTMPVTFRYQAGGTNRIQSRRDRRGAVTQFAYDAGARLATAKLSLGGADSINLVFCAAEVRGLAACSPSLVVPDSAYTRLDGPRTDSADVQDFWVDRFGSPWKVRDPYGYVTTLTAGDPSWPALVTRIQHPNGWIEGATYDARGNLAASTDSSINATTRYQWDQRWDHVTEITLPTGEVSRFGYDQANGNRLWQEDGRGTSSRVSYEYYTAGSGAKLLRAIIQPGGARDSLAYDARGNLILTRTPLGWETRFDNDRLGRTTVVRTQLGGGQWRHDSTSYDQLSQVRRSVAYGPGSPQGQRLIVQDFYNQEGLLDSLQRTALPDTAGVGLLVTRWKYDAAGRRVAEYAPDGYRDSTVYDKAGNAVRVITRRGDTLTMAFDRLNRLRRRVVPAVTYPARNEGIAPLHMVQYVPPHPYPWYTNDAAGELTLVNDGNDSLTIRADTATFGYDAMGNMLTANNRDAKVKRTYAINGRLETDSLRIRTYTGTDSTTHTYGLAYRYDLSGRLARLRHPFQLVPRTPTVKDSAYYEYDPVTGALAAVTDPLGGRFEFAYNTRNERIRLGLPGGIVDSAAYDLDGRLQTSWIKNHSGSPFKSLDSLFRLATLTYADRERVAFTRNTWGLRDTVTAFYSGLGHLIELQYRLPANSNLGNQAQLFSSEKFTLDPLGNIYAGRDSTNIHKHDGFQSVVTTSDASYAPLAGQPSTGRLRQRRAGSQYTDYTYDHAGNTVFSSATTFREDRASFYGADGLLRVAEHRLVQENGVDPAAWWWWETFEEYRYDALGRRILVRMRRNCYLTSPGEACRFSTIRRTVWEGPRELYEIQMPGGDLEPATELEKDTAAVQRGACQAPSCQTYFDPNPLFGRVGYAYGGGVDEPLSIIRINYVDKPWDDPSYRVWLPFSMVPHWNWRGQAEYGTFGDGGARLCVSPSSTRCVEIQWRAKAFAFTQQTQDLAVNASTNHTWAWLGTLRDLKEDGTGTLYQRNRYVDPATGRFTQEDPLGLAGGLNLYGFAAGDPVNFSDPFGLCDKLDNPTCKHFIDKIAALFSSFQAKAAEVYAQGLATAAKYLSLLLPGSGNIAEAATGSTFEGERLSTGQRVAHAALGMGEAGLAAAGGAGELSITFKSAHGALHLEGTGLAASEVESAIAADVRAGVAGASRTSNFWGRVNVAGKVIEYRAYTLENGVINIGTYYPP